ncbi:hypothetical protein DRO55_04160 [Candidatus Bathyarchaeota archaeon]|nr:MAG: hypothetical protein DRO55_04160 [Candidatus Bathyarchaeota archaeon]
MERAEGYGRRIVETTYSTFKRDSGEFCTVKGVHLQHTHKPINTQNQRTSQEQKRDSPSRELIHKTFS